MTEKKQHSVFNLSEVNSRINITENDQLENHTKYNPFDFRDQIKGASTKHSLTHLLKGSLGCGILAMPMAFKNAGLLFGVIGSILSGIVCTHCVHILVNASQQVCCKAQVPALSFADTAKTVFSYGPKPLRPWSNFAKEFVDGALMMTYYTSTSVYILFIAQSFHDVINYNFKLNWDIRIYIAFTVIPLIFVGQVRTLKYLVPFSSIANILIIIAFGITLYYIFKEPLVFSDKPLIANIQQIPTFFATAILAMEGIGSVMPVENSMKKPQHFLGFPGVLTTAMTIIVTLYTVIGFLGYARYGDEARGSITLNLTPGTLICDLAKILMAISVLLTFGLLFFVPNEILWKKISHKFNKENRNMSQIIIRLVITIVSGILTAIVPNLEPVIGLVGAIFFSLLGFFIPSVIQIIFLWPKKLGFCKWILVKNIILMLLSIFLMISGSYISISQMIDLYK